MVEELIIRLEEIISIAEDEGAEETQEELLILKSDYEAGIYS